ncbi:MAG: cold-shock protein, partial [Chloroflexota bacterium]
MRGTVGDLVIDRGFGFITGEDGQQLFFHRNALQGTDFGELAPGVAVEFDVRHHVEGDEPGEHPRAVNVRLAPDAVPAADHEVLPP